VVLLNWGNAEAMIEAAVIMNKVIRVEGLSLADVTLYVSVAISRLRC
jgi:hypothetical protein